MNSNNRNNNFKNRLISVIITLIILVSSTDLGICQSVSDTSNLSVQFAVGVGLYNYNETKNPPKIAFIDKAASVDYYFLAFRFGIKGGSSRSESDNIDFNSSYINPNVGFISQYVGLDVGYIFITSKKNFYFVYPFSNKTTYLPGLASGSLRLGDPNGFYLNISLANNLPLRSAGGMYKFGAGYKLEKTNTSLFFGLGFSPYKSAIFSVHQDLPLTEKMFLNISGSVGGFKGYESGFAIGNKIWL